MTSLKSEQNQESRSIANVMSGRTVLDMRSSVPTSSLYLALLDFLYPPVSILVSTAMGGHVAFASDM